MAYPTYPEKFKQKYWDSHKGLLAKTKGFTGVGAALTLAESSWGKCPAITFSPQQTYPSVAAWQTAFDNAKKEYALVTTAHKAIQAALKALKDAKTLYAGQALLKGAVKTCDEMINIGILFENQVIMLDRPWLNSKAATEKKFAMAKKNIKDGILNCENCEKKLPKAPTANDYETIFLQAIRGLAAAVPIHPETKAMAPQFKVLSSVPKDKLKSSQEVVDHVKKVMELVDKLKIAVG